jgi:hypothetical protein
LTKYQVHQVGDAQHCEYWIPAVELGSFNDQIVGLIEVMAEFRPQA